VRIDGSGLRRGTNVAIGTSLKGRLRNTSLPHHRALLPLFEAVVNAIQSVDLAHPDPGADRAKITVEIHRVQALSFEPDSDPTRGQRQFDPITGFTVRDNGEGFHDDNMRSFQTLDSDFKAVLGCRGVGRLLWLKAFQKVNIDSVYRDDVGQTKQRSFTFTEDNDISGHLEGGTDSLETGATVRLVGFHEAYRKTAPKSLAIIARDILEHCLWYFVRPGGAPIIVIEDGPESVALQSIFDDYLAATAVTEHLNAKGEAFDIVHLRLRTTVKDEPHLYWCAANRVVTEEKLKGKIDGLYGKVRDADGEFMYACFLSSPYLDKRVRSERTEFDIPENNDGALDENEPSRGDIRAQVIEAAQRHLEQYLVEARKAGRERVAQFVDTKAPRYRPILRHIDQDKISADPSVSDRELELQLHKHLADIEQGLLAEGQEVLGSDTVRDEDYEKRLKNYLDKVEDIKKSDLAGYVTQRRVILDLLARAMRTDNGRYAPEDVIHRLIMPMRATSDDVPPEACNLWVIDERLAFHNYLASDKTINSMPITGATDHLEPDLLGLIIDRPVLVAEDEQMPLASIVVVEFKRPMRNDAGGDAHNDPLQQTYRYLKRVREGQVRTASGRPIPKSDEIPGYCYVITDLTTTVEERCINANLRRTQDGLGYFGYNDPLRTYVEVISFDRLLNEATRRNRAFFDKLGLPAS
jgi:hypothetical protein